MSPHRDLRTIVVATDFSEDAACALGWAKELALEQGARVVLVHAFVAEAVPAPEFVPLPAQYYEEIHGEARQRLENEARLLRDAGIEVTTELVLSSPVLAVSEVAMRHGADLVVAGTRGRTGWKRALLGSTAARLVREAPCPVLTVHRHDALKPRPVRTCWCLPTSRRTRSSPPTPPRTCSAASARIAGWWCCTRIACRPRRCTFPPRC